jgi:hypothetical protein
VTTASNSIAVTVSTGNAVLTAGSPVSASSGVATFSAVTLTDSDGGANNLTFSTGGLTSAISADVTIAPPVPVAVQWQEPIAGGVAGIALPPFTAHIVDSSNVLVPTAANSVALSVSGGASLGGTTTRQAVSGVATFDDITVTPAGSYTFTGTSTGLTSDTSAAVTITAASGSYPNLPAGYTEIVHSPCDVLPGTTWAQVSGSVGYHIRGASNPLTVQTDATAPLTPSSVIRTQFNNGQAGGSTSVSWESWANSNSSSPTQYSKIYISRRFKIGTTSGFQNQAVGTKFGFIAFGESPSLARNQIFLLWKGNGSTSVMTASNFNLEIQRPAAAVRTIAFGGGTSLITTGVWHHLELLLEINSAANAADGVFKAWVNGTLRANQSNVVYRVTGATNKFFWYKWEPTWGGTGGTRSQVDYVYEDDVSIYGQL